MTSIANYLNDFDPTRLRSSFEEHAHRRLRSFHQRGYVVAVSGGVDSAATVALAASVLGRERVRGLYLPERDTSSSTGGFVDELRAALDIQIDERPIRNVLAAADSYRIMDNLLKEKYPRYTAADCAFRTELTHDLESDGLPRNELVIERNQTEVSRTPIGRPEMRLILSANNLKQRTRMMLTYSKAESLGFGVLNTSNRLEHELGFFVRYGDGAGDLAPLLRLYKCDVRSLARSLQVPDRVAQRASTTDTFSAPQDQAAYFFGMPEEHVDASLGALTVGASPSALAEHLDRGVEYASNAMRLVERRRNKAVYARSGLEPLER